VHGVATSFTLAAVARFRWRRVLPTRRLLRLTALDLLLLVLLWWPLPGSHARDTAPLRALVRFEGWGYAVGSGYAFYALFALLVSLARDPSLGIHRVHRRLALSHVLVVLVPVTLIAMLWVAGTVLGVGTERATVAAR